MVTRILAAKLAKSTKSLLLLEPRQVGKATLIGSLNPDLIIDMADEMEYLTHSSDPAEIRRLIERNEPKTVFIYEVQRLPRILNTVQSIVDNRTSTPLQMVYNIH
ncbi:MAG: hypothetical protein KDD59_04500 [Bdellovibrionales bacterium]|nr:hypothetical protein [Bdellovibrionales bacterium]